MKKECVLIVEDDADIREGVRILLESENYEVKEAENGFAGVELAKTAVDLVILDVMMPGMSGLRACEEIRKFSNVPILFLTAKSQESDKLIGLMAGGDDYLSKPFSYAELLGRVRALLRRYGIYGGKKELIPREQNGFLERGDLRINRNRNEVYLKGEKLDFTETEYGILLLLVSNKGRIFSAQMVYESVWNEPYFYSCNSTIMVHIRKIRVKLGDDSKNPKYIKTIWGKGYCYEGE